MESVTRKFVFRTPDVLLPGGRERLGTRLGRAAVLDHLVFCFPLQKAGAVACQDVNECLPKSDLRKFLYCIQFM